MKTTGQKSIISVSQTLADSKSIQKENKKLSIELTEKKIAMDLMQRHIDHMKMDRQFTEKYLERLRTFSLPYVIKPSKFKVVRNNGFDVELTLFCQNSLVFAFSHCKKLASVMPDMVS